MEDLIGIDIGGTFTEVVVLDAAGNLSFAMAFLTPHRSALGVIAALESGARTQKPPDGSGGATG